METMTIQEFIKRRKLINDQIIGMKLLEREEVKAVCQECQADIEEQNQKLEAMRVQVKQAILMINRTKNDRLDAIRRHYTSNRMNLDLDLRELDATFYEQRRMKSNSIQAPEGKDMPEEDSAQHDIEPTDIETIETSTEK